MLGHALISLVRFDRGLFFCMAAFKIASGRSMLKSVREVWWVWVRGFAIAALVVHQAVLEETFARNPPQNRVPLTKAPHLRPWSVLLLGSVLEDLG